MGSSFVERRASVRAGTSVVALAVVLVAMGLGAAGADAGKQRQYKAPAVTTTLDAKVRGSIGQIYVEDAEPGSTLLLANPNGIVIRSGKADTNGSKIFRELAYRWGYQVIQPDGDQVAGSRKLRALRPGDDPPQSYYDNLPEIKPGINYVTMRDGVKLAVTLRLPLGKTISQGPFPTVIEHSGYETAAPGNLLASLLGGPARSARTFVCDRDRLGPRPAAWLCLGQRPDARQRLLGRRLRPVRPADNL